MYFMVKAYEPGVGGVAAPKIQLAGEFGGGNRRFLGIREAARAGKENSGKNCYTFLEFGPPSWQWNKTFAFPGW